MNKSRLEKEGKKWVDENLISDEQLQSILQRYERKDHSYLLVVFAALLVSIGILIFIFSDWAQVAHISRVSMMIFFMLLLYGAGIYFYRKEKRTEKNAYSQSQIIGISFIILGYIMFGATLFLTIYIYGIYLQSVWPFVIWSIAGLLLYMILPNNYLFIIALLITIYGQLHNWLNYSSFDYILFVIFLIGYFHYVYHRGNALFHYTFTIGLSLQLLVLVNTEFEQFYWFILFVLLVYGLAQIMLKPELKNRMINISIITMFVYKIFETTYIQESYFLDELKLQPLFLILWGVAIILIGFLLWKTDKKELITFTLFLPLLFLPYAHFFIMISLFVYSLFWLIYGFQVGVEQKITLGMMSFLFSTFIVFIQYAWETLNKSLFFLIAGVILFLISAIFERRRRKHIKGGDSQ